MMKDKPKAFILRFQETLEGGKNQCGTQTMTVPMIKKESADADPHNSGSVIPIELETKEPIP